MQNNNHILYPPKRHLFFYVITFVSVILYILLYSTKIHHNFNNKSYLLHINNFFTKIGNSLGAADPDENLSDLACRIPKTQPFEPSIVEAIFEDKDDLEEFEECSDSYPLLFSSSMDPYPRLIPLLNVAEFRENFTIHDCCYRTISRGGSFSIWPDHGFTLSPKCYPISLQNETKIVDPSNHQFISIECQHAKVDIVKRPEDTLPSYPESVFNTIVDMHTFVKPPPLPQKPDVDSTEENVGKNVTKMNVLIFGLDAMSRNNFIRTFPDSHDYLLNSLNAVDMEMYNKIGDNSMPNLGPFLTNLPVVGDDEENLKCEVNYSFDTCPFIWNHFKKAGYLTSYTDDDRRLGLFHYLKNGFKRPPTDYYLRPFWSAADKHIGTGKLLFSKMCCGPRLSFEVMVDYVKKLTSEVTIHKNRNLFQFIWSSSVTHDFLNAGYLLDTHFLEFLKWLQNGGHLNNTLLIVMGDHGARWGPIRSYYQGQLKERLPAMYLVFPPWFRQKYQKANQNLLGNRKRLVTVWDLHQTLLDLLHLDEQVKDHVLPLREASEEHSPGISLFLPISKERTCKTAAIPDSYCTCNHQVTQVDTKDEDVIYGANFAVEMINKWLSSDKKFDKLCAKLELKRIMNAGKASFGNSTIWQGYQINFETVPGEGQFEALVVHDTMLMAKRNWTVSGKILRTNLHGNQSWCVDDRKAKLYCYCEVDH